METQRITIEAKTARELYREYKKHQHYSTPIDDEIRRAYQLLAQGRLVIQAIESIRAAGLNEQGLPKLAIGRSSLPYIRCNMDGDGGGRMESEHASRSWTHAPETRERIIFSRGFFPRGKSQWSARALLPPIPLNLRPKRGLANYHTLWEAEWTAIVPHDPFLLRRIGKGDMWLVVAMWDLTEVERTALSARVTPQ